MTEDSPDIVEKVKTALRNAKENGYDLINSNLPPGAIATDMMDYDADLEDEEFLEVCAVINAIRAGVYTP